MLSLISSNVPRDYAERVCNHKDILPKKVSVTMLFPIVLARVSGGRVMAAKCQLCIYGLNISCAEKLSSDNQKETPTDSSATFSKCSPGVKIPGERPMVPTA